MSDYIKRIRTVSGDKQIDYTALANLPVADSTLTLKGSFADAKVVGDQIYELIKKLNDIEINGGGTGGGTVSPEDVERAIEEYLAENRIEVKAIDVLDFVYDEANRTIEFIDADSPITIDPYLATAGHAADAKAVGDALDRQAQYNAETYALKGEVPDVEFDMTVVDDGEGNLTFGTDVSEVIMLSSDAKDSGYNNTVSGLTAINVQDAIDELSLNKIEIEQDMSNVKGDLYKITNGILTSVDDIMNVTENGHLVDALAVKEMILSGNGNISVNSITIGGGKLVWNTETESIDIVPVE